MAGLTDKRLLAREQFAAILQMRWLVFLHSLRTRQGKMELVSRILFAGLATMAGLGGFVGFGVGAYYFASHQQCDSLAFLLWPVMLFWQMFPVMSTAFSGTVDSTNLVRFPLSYRSYYLIQLVDGLIGPASLIPCLWLLGIMLGIAVCSPSLFLPAALVLATFGLVNLLLSRMVLSWVERWMQQRRTREIFGLIFFVLMMSMQFIGPIMGRIEHKQKREVTAVVQQFSALQKPLPPGAAAEAIADVAKGDLRNSALYFSVLGAYGAAFFSLLGVRTKALYRGENLSEVARKQKSTIDRRLKPGWDVFGWPGPIAAMFEKEIRYLSRSGQMLLALLSPLLLTVLFKFQSNTGNPLMRTSSRAFQVGAALAVMSTMNMFQNSFGGDGGGLQMFYAAPVKFRQIMLGKNLAHAAVCAAELAAVSLALAFFGLIPPIEVVVSTLAAALFAIIAEATVGNMLSLYVPKKIDFGKFNRQQGSPAAVLASLAGIVAIFGLSALVLFVSPMLGSIWIATGIMTTLTCAAAFAYFGVLNQVDRIAFSRQEKLLAEICRT
jgi:ABC-2 type transport system permease protein